MTAMSVVPPPMSTIMLPNGSVMGRPGADRGRHRLVHQVDLAGPRSQRAVPHGPPLDLGDFRRHADDDARTNASPMRCVARRMKSVSIRSAASKSAMTPSRSGLMATRSRGVRPIMSLALVPTASIRFCAVL